MGSTSIRDADIPLSPCHDSLYSLVLIHIQCTHSVVFLPHSGYHYQKLNYALGQQICLIRLLPIGEVLDTILCRTRHVNLEDDPAYEDVSYT